MKNQRLQHHSTGMICMYVYIDICICIYIYMYYCDLHMNFWWFDVLFFLGTTAIWLVWCLEPRQQPQRPGPGPCRLLKHEQRWTNTLNPDSPTIHTPKWGIIHNSSIIDFWVHQSILMRIKDPKLPCESCIFLLLPGKLSFRLLLCRPSIHGFCFDGPQNWSPKP